MALRLVLGRTVSALATGLIPTTLTLALLGSAHADDLGLVLAAEMVPMLLLLPVAGVFADRLPPRRVIAAADLTRAGAQVLIGVELLLGVVRVVDLAVLAAITGAAIAFGTPAVRTLVVAAVESADRLRVNARMETGMSLAMVAAPALAGGLMLGVGAGWSSLLTGLLYVASAVTLGGLPLAAMPARGERAPFWSELREGWTVTRHHPWFLGNVLGHGVWHLAAGFLLTLGPLIAVADLGGERSWVIVVQVGTVGLLAGVLVSSRLPIVRPLRVVAIGAASFALPLAAFAFRWPLALAAGSYFVAMVGLGVLTPLWETAVQRRIPAAALGRVGSFDALISFAARPLGFAVAAPVAVVAGTMWPLLVGAVLVAVANLAVLAMPDVRHDVVEPARARA